MKIILAYRFTGEDPTELGVTIGSIVKALRDAGHTVYCSLEDETWFREKKRTNAEIMSHAFEQIDSVDAILAFVRSNEKSEGMLLEIGYGLAKGKRLIIALKNGINMTSLHQMANPLITFDTLEELCEKLKTI